MFDAYEVQSFNQDYCQDDVRRIATAVKNRSSLLVIGMPGCGKSRLMDFIFSRPDIMKTYDLPPTLNAIRIDVDALTTNPQSMYMRLLRTLNPTASPNVNTTIDMLKEQLMTELGSLNPDANLVIVFDNFNPQIQKVLGESFFNFLYALRNSRPKLNLSYIYMANLKIDRFGFYKASRLFDGGVDRSTCWLALLNQQDTQFSIERQWSKAGYEADYFDGQLKEKLFEMSGGHALLNRQLSHLALHGDVTIDSEPKQLLDHSTVRTVCQAIWQDLNQKQKNFLIDAADKSVSATSVNLVKQELIDYGVISSSLNFFSAVYGRFVSEQKKGSEVLFIHCDQSQSTLTVTTVDQQKSDFSFSDLPLRKQTLLCYLVENCGETCSKDQLKDVGWPAEQVEYVTDQALDRQVEDLKKWIKTQKPLAQYIAIEAVWGVGRKLVIVG